MSKRNIETVTVLGAGTMGSGIAAACAQSGYRTLLLDVSGELAQRGKENMLAGRAPMLDDPKSADLITTGGFDDSLGLASDSDWICEAIVEDLEAKRSIFSRLEEFESLVQSCQPILPAFHFDQSVRACRNSSDRMLR